MSCQHIPQRCDDANSSAGAQSGRGADFGTAERTAIPGQNNPEPSVLGEAINTPANCDDNCDDGNSSTTDFCGPSGCVNMPLLVESGNVYPVEFLSPVLPEMHNEIARENNIINESQSGMEEATAQPLCNDGNPCTTDAYNGTGCVYTPMNCDDGNDSTLDSCRDGTCINEPIDRSSINLQSENNSTALSSSEALMAGHPRSCDDHDPCTVDTLNGTRCEHKPKDCDDGNPNTLDYCYGGVCYNTTTSCDDGKPCTIDSYNGTACVHTPKSCNDGNPCTLDYCDRVRGCLHSPMVCGQGKTCINGVCQYPYYPYDATYYPYYPYYPYVAPASTLPSAQSYTIPAGTAITLPWAKSVTALNTLKVENGIAYSSGSPLRFVRLLGLEDQAISGYQSGLSISEWAEMIGLSWKDAGFTLTLIQPDGSTLPVQGDNLNVMHLVGSNYDYYFLRSAAIGNWGIEVRPRNPVANGVGYSLITGLVKGAAPINLP